MSLSVRLPADSFPTGRAFPPYLVRHSGLLRAGTCKALNQLREKISRLSQAEKDAQEYISKLEEEREQLIFAEESLAEELDVLSAEVANVKGENETLSEAKQKLEEEWEQLKKDHQKALLEGQQLL